MSDNKTKELYKHRQGKLETVTQLETLIIRCTPADSGDILRDDSLFNCGCSN